MLWVWTVSGFRVLGYCRVWGFRVFGFLYGLCGQSFWASGFRIYGFMRLETEACAAILVFKQGHLVVAAKTTCLMVHRVRTKFQQFFVGVAACHQISIRMLSKSHVLSVSGNIQVH